MATNPDIHWSSAPTSKTSHKHFELPNHLGNVLATVSDEKMSESDSSGGFSHFAPRVLSTSDYYPFGLAMEGRTFSSEGYRWGFNGMERDYSIAGEHYDFGARIYNAENGRWLSLDPLQAKYPSLSAYNFVSNTPLNAIDPDGRLILFINGLRGAPNPLSGKDQYSGPKGIYSVNSTWYNALRLRNYWRTVSGKTNSFGRKVDMIERFMERIGDFNAYMTSGSDHWTSKAKEKVGFGYRSRYKQGIRKAKEFHRQVKKGLIKLEDGESIKIVSHSQGGAHAAGFINQLKKYKSGGEQVYNIEVVYHITPHQPTDIPEHTQDGTRGVQYSHPLDAVSSNPPWWMSNGGTEFGEINGIDEFDGRDIMGSGSQNLDVAPTGASGNLSGHDVKDNDFIFDIPRGEDGFVAPRQDRTILPTVTVKPKY